MASNTGNITITYGNQANTKALAAGQNVLGLIAYTNTNNDIIWICGGAAVPGTDARHGPTAGGATTVKPQYLPSVCHS